MFHFLFQRHHFPIIFSQTVPEDLPQFSTDITHDKHLLHRRNGTDGLQRVIQKMGIDLCLEGAKFRDSQFGGCFFFIIHQLIDLRSHIIIGS